MNEAPKKSYSIWSLLVIMTLLAAWLAVPRRPSPDVTTLTYGIFVFAHQVTLWTLVGFTIWSLTGKRKRVALFVMLVIVLVWSPCACALIEIACYRDMSVCIAALESVGLLAFYQRFYELLIEAFGYYL